jgi:2-oxoglutarate ferredoxin oxidoreductase subunit alpha
MQAIFRMGIPVSGKNLFPSNIQGLPTWYEIRVNKDGHTARTAEYDLMVAMNAETYARDVKEVARAAICSTTRRGRSTKSLMRADVTFLGVPYAQMCNDAFTESRERTLMKNIVYAGTLAALLDIDMDDHRGDARREVRQEAGAHGVEQEGHRARRTSTRRSTSTCPLPIRLEKMDATKDSILIDGNTATALGCVYAGATVGAWYPITPSTSVLDAFKEFCEKYRTDKETGEKRYCILQAEDELAAIGMVIGAAWNGARAFTSTSGPASRS